MTTFSMRALPAALAATVLGIYFATPAYCDDYPANSLRVGIYSVFYHVSAENLQGPYVPAGANIDAKNVETLYLAYVRSLTPNLDFELTAGYPPLQKTVGRGPATLGSVPYNGQVIATARWIAPTALIEYVFFDPNARLRPFIGAGVNYTTFYDRDSTAAGDAASGGPTKLSLTRSIGPAGTVGLAWNLGSNWHMYGSYNISRVNTDLTADTAGVIRTTHIKFGPQALVVSLGYSF